LGEQPNSTSLISEGRQAKNTLEKVLIVLKRKKVRTIERKINASAQELLTLKDAGFLEVFFWRNEVCLIKFSFK
jgi:hypothetical protein